MRTAAAAVAFSALLAAFPAAAGSNAGPSGLWTGQMRQIDPQDEHSYHMTLVLRGRTGTTSYPSLKCSGTLTRIASTKDGYVLYAERIENEPGGTCIDGILALRQDGMNLVLGWFAAFEGAPILASAVLSKEAG